MIVKRPSAERGHRDHGWLDTRHTFSFADYRDPAHMGFRTLRVINEDVVQPGEGFGAHPHRDMEIVTYVLEGALAHRDSMGNGSTIHPGDVQRMSAGTGVTHSEQNASRVEPVHFLQIWILPDREGLPPGYEQRRFEEGELRGRLRLVASPDGGEGSVTVHQSARLYAARLAPGEEAVLTLAPGRHGWIQVVQGSLGVNGHRLASGDGAALSEEPRVRLEGLEDAHVLAFDLA